MSAAALQSLRVRAYTATSAVGRGRAATLAALRARRSGLRANDFGPQPVPTWIGRVEGVEEEPLPKEFAQWECRNNRLAWMGLAQDEFLSAVASARARHGPARVAVLFGTSTSSIGATEEAYRHLGADGAFPEDLRRAIIHTPHSTGDFVQHALGLTGYSATVATACSSSAKVFAQAQRIIHAGVADAAVVGGVDSLCDSVLYGFNSLQLLSPEPCRPFDAKRAGINLSEAAGFALLERAGEGEEGQREGPWLLGFGESSDAHHMSAPHPEGLSVTRAMREALARAGMQASDIGYINLHGTASLKNDEVEAAAIKALFSERVFASSTKGWTGHALGAAGILEAVITLLALDAGHLPGTLNTTVLDPVCGPQIRMDNQDAKVRNALSLSFGFGGSNCVLLFGQDRPRR
ncbi:MAG: beta-ketoacyl-[acyl-carrier-protein] synthase family protein [Burkholderiales bacterium]